MQQNMDILVIFILFVIVCIIYYIFSSQYIEYKKNISSSDTSYKRCRKSTIDNPMGNVLLYTDIKDMDNKLCLHNNVDNNLKYNIYYDSKDLYSKGTNTRSFITMPSQTNPNDTKEYYKYLYYLDNPSCKIDSMNCMFNSDLRYHKNEFLTKY